MRLVIVLCVLATALAVPEGYHYDAPAVTSTLYFPNLPEDDCEQPAPLQPEVTFQKEFPTYTQHVYTAPVKQQVQVVQPLKTQVTYEKEQVQSVWGSSGQQAQSTVWGSLGSLQKVEPAPQKVTQLNLWDTSKQQQQQSSSWGSSSSNVWNSASQQQEQSSVWVKPQRQVEEVYKHVYVHVPPEDKEEYQPPQIIQPVAHKQKHYKIIFIKAPSPPAPKSVVVPPQPQNEEKTIVYVLHQKPEHKQEVIVQKPEPAKQNKPEVFFIKYKNQKEQVKQEVKYVSSTAAPASWEAKSSSGSSSYSSGSSGSSYSFVSSTAAPVVYTTPAPVVKIVESAPVSYSSSSSSSSSSSNSGYSNNESSGSYSFVSSTASPVAYTTGHSVKIVESAPTGYEAASLSSGFDYSSGLGSSGSSYSSFSSGSGAQSSGYESYVDLGNSGYSGFSSGLGVINVGSNDYSSTAAPVVKSTSYVSTTPHSVVSSTIGGLGGDVSVRNSGSSGYAQRSSGRSRGTTVGTTKKPCRRCASSTSAPLTVHENTYVSNVY